jgi:hypothetical protein
VSAEGVNISFRRGRYNGQVVASPGLPNGRVVALSLAARQYGALPDVAAPAASGSSAEALGRFVAEAGISLGMLALLCIGAVAVVRSLRGRAAPPSPEVPVVPGSWTAPPGGWAPAPPREPALAGSRRKGSTI